MVKVAGNDEILVRNEVKEYQDMRSFGASESLWRLYQFEMSDR